MDNLSDLLTSKIIIKKEANKSTSIFGHIRFRSRAEVLMHPLMAILSVAKADLRLTLGLSPASSCCIDLEQKGLLKQAERSRWQGCVCTI